MTSRSFRVTILSAAGLQSNFTPCFSPIFDKENFFFSPFSNRMEKVFLFLLENKTEESIEKGENSLKNRTQPLKPKIYRIIGDFFFHFEEGNWKSCKNLSSPLWHGVKVIYAPRWNIQSGAKHLTLSPRVCSYRKVTHL